MQDRYPLPRPIDPKYLEAIVQPRYRQDRQELLDGVRGRQADQAPFKQVVDPSALRVGDLLMATRTIEFKLLFISRVAAITLRSDLSDVDVTFDHLALSPHDPMIGKGRVQEVADTSEVTETKTVSGAAYGLAALGSSDGARTDYFSYTTQYFIGSALEAES